MQRCSVPCLWPGARSHPPKPRKAKTNASLEAETSTSSSANADSGGSSPIQYPSPSCPSSASSSTANVFGSYCGTHKSHEHCASWVGPRTTEQATEDGARTTPRAAISPATRSPTGNVSTAIASAIEARDSSTRSGCGRSSSISVSSTRRARRPCGTRVTTADLRCRSGSWRSCNGCPRSTRASKCCRCSRCCFSEWTSHHTEIFWTQTTGRPHAYQLLLGSTDRDPYCVAEQGLAIASSEAEIEVSGSSENLTIASAWMGL